MVGLAFVVGSIAAGSIRYHFAPVAPCQSGGPCAKTRQGQFPGEVFSHDRHYNGNYTQRHSYWRIFVLSAEAMVLFWTYHRERCE